MLENISPRVSFSLIISDVIGNDLQTIASGPTAPDNTTFDDAVRICKKTGIFDKLSEAVKFRLLQGKKKLIGETPKSYGEEFGLVHNLIIGSAYDSANAVLNYLESQGIPSTILSNRLSGEAKSYGLDFPRFISKLKLSSNPSGFILTGELTVTLKGNGKGGRNQEMLLAFIHKIYES